MIQIINEESLLLYAFGFVCNHADHMRPFKASTSFREGLPKHIFGPVLECARNGGLTLQTMEELREHVQGKRPYKLQEVSWEFSEDQVYVPHWGRNGYEDPHLLREQLEWLRRNCRDAIQNGVSIRRGLFSVIGDTTFTRNLMLQLLPLSFSCSQPAVAQCWRMVWDYSSPPLRLELESQIMEIMHEHQAASDRGDSYWSILISEDLLLESYAGVMHVSMAGTRQECPSDEFMNALQESLGCYIQAI